MLTGPSTIVKFIEWRKENALPPNKARTFNLLYNDPNLVEPEEYRVDLCCEFSGRIDESNHYGIINKCIPSGRCARIRHIGSDDTIVLPIKYLYMQWLNEQGHELRDFPLFFERVSFFPEVPEKDMITDIYLPIK